MQVSTESHGVTDGLFDHHRKELIEASAIDPEVVRERGYRTIARPTPNDQRPRHEAQRLGFPSWAIREDHHFPALHIPQYGPRGDRYAGQIKPRIAVPDRTGKKMKYAAAKGGALRLDVHPRWSADRGQRDAALVPAIQDPALRLWITEGVKKADSLTSRGEVTVALSGVFNWRNQHGTLGDWEDVRLRGREIVICFDADAITKVQVASAMQRLGKWLVHKGAAKVWYCVVPAAVNGSAVKGVDDFFAAGGTLKDLEKAFESRPPQVTSVEDRFTDARLAETLASEVLDGVYVWAAGLDWMRWDGRRWAEVHEVTVIETVRQWALDEFASAVQAMRADPEKASVVEVDGWRTMLSASRQRTVLNLARGIVERRPEEFDADADLVNTPGGVFSFATDEMLPHSPEFMCTKITSGAYRPGFRHRDVDKVLSVLPDEVAAWMQVRFGQAITGHTTPDGVIPILRSGGESGKSLLTTDGVVPALGGYASVASAKLLASSKNEHSTERADLRGKRFVMTEELTEGRSIDVTALKQIADVGRINARKIRKDNIEFDASHSLFASTNYQPVIAETDHGTWRRLALVEFPYTFVKPGKPITDPEHERRGDPSLKDRIKANKSGQHDAFVTWVIEGARRWYANLRAIEVAILAGDEPPASVMLPPARVEADTDAWRAEADRVLGYWRQCLMPDPTAYVLCSEIVEHFNEWMATNGHNAWPKETFGSRFRDHGETKRNRVTQLPRQRSAKFSAHLARRPSTVPPRPLPTQVDLYRGLRYRTDADCL